MYQYSRPDTKSAKILCPKMFGGKISTTKIDTHGRAWSIPIWGNWARATVSVLLGRRATTVGGTVVAGK